MSDELHYMGLAQLKTEGERAPYDPLSEITMAHADPEDGDVLILSSGRRLTPNRGIFGISPDGTVTEGYDNGLKTELSDNDELTAEEKTELALHMIQRWRDWGGI